MYRFLLAMTASLLVGEICFAEPPNFRRDVYPLLQSRCFECHRGFDADSGVRLDLREEILGETTGKPLAIPGDSKRSRLHELVSGRDPDKRMPPEGNRLTAEEMALLGRWIDAGLPWDDALLPPVAPESDHWAFQAVKRPAVPSLSLNSDLANPIDAFVAANQQEAGLAFAPEADRRTLIRRLYFDLLGLPPSPEEVDAFVSDQRPDASERLVDCLLASPQHGERWGRHWLDIARWAESEGFESNHPRPFAWRYRDYVVDSSNRDRPFDQFIVQQIAGDELPEYSDENLIATGFLAAARISSNEEDKWLQRNDVNVDIVNAVGSALLGVSLHCAQCHNHKFDPFPARDFYRLQAFFVRGQPANIRLRDADSASDDFEKQRHYEAAVDERERLLALGRQHYVEWERERLSDAQRQAVDTPLDQRTIEQELLARKVALTFERTANEYEKHIPESNRARYGELKKQIAELEKERSLVPQTFAYYSPVQSPHKLEVLPSLGFYPLPFDSDFFTRVRPYVMVRGDVHAIGLHVQPGWPKVLAGPPVGVPPSGGVEESRLKPELQLRRTDLARWLADRNNPLVARVWANRIWHYHFGRGIVATTDDFGVKGAAPTHPELLDWLAAELVDSGWSTKHLHRLIVTSRTYRQTSRVGVPALAGPPEGGTPTDPDNRLLTRFTPRRLEAETLRDAMLSATGELDLSLGGGSVPIEQREKSPRRSLYLFQKRGQASEMQTLFDGPNECSAICGSRLVSTSPLQSLYLLNSQFSSDRAERLSEIVRARSGDDSDCQIDDAFRIVLQRVPTEEERRAAKQLLVTDVPVGVPPSGGAEEDRLKPGLQLLCQALLNLNEFAYLE